jgi:GT2 family glycosyltransferase
LSDTVEVVHFIDDDVTLGPDYFGALTSVLRSKPDVGGVGGLILEPERKTAPTWHRLLKRVFFLDHHVDGRILPSGWTTSAQLAGSIPDDESLRSTEWLSGTSSYRRSLLEHHRFDKALEGYSMLEDLDFSYRVGQETRLLVQPSARLLHRRASTNRFDAEHYHRALTIHKRWFLDKNLRTCLADYATRRIINLIIAARTIASDISGKCS